MIIELLQNYALYNTVKESKSLNCPDFFMVKLNKEKKEYIVVFIHISYKNYIVQFVLYLLMNETWKALLNCDCLWYFNLFLCFRFFCPPPSLYLKGKGWTKRRERNNAQSSQDGSNNNNNAESVVATTTTTTATNTTTTNNNNDQKYPHALVFIGPSEHPLMQQLTFEEKVGLSTRLFCFRDQGTSKHAGRKLETKPLFQNLFGFSFIEFIKEIRWIFISLIHIFTNDVI